MGNIGEPQRVIDIPKPIKAPVFPMPSRAPVAVPDEPERVKVPVR